MTTTTIAMPPRGNHNVCFSCYDEQIFQFYGQTDRYPKMKHDYIADLYDGEEFYCRWCQTKVRYVQDGDNWRENIVAVKEDE